MMNSIAESTERVAQRTPAAVCVVAVDPTGPGCVTAGDSAGPDAARAVVDLWRRAELAARDRSPSSLDHVVMNTTVGGLAIVRCGGFLVAAVARRGVRPDRLAYELRRAVADVCAHGPDSGAGL